jgi:hypothetical protein
MFRKLKTQNITIAQKEFEKHNLEGRGDGGY